MISLGIETLEVVAIAEPLHALSLADHSDEKTSNQDDEAENASDGSRL